MWPWAPLSLSARRAWIEILIDLVDSPIAKESLSARRAWIEIFHLAQGKLGVPGVALRKESVDRNSERE